MISWKYITFFYFPQSYDFLYQEIIFTFVFACDSDVRTKQWTLDMDKRINLQFVFISEKLRQKHLKYFGRFMNMMSRTNVF